MKRFLCVFLAAGLFCSLTGCQETGMPRPDFPLEEDVVAAALEQTGLPGVISPSETQSYTEGHIAYTLRDPEQTYGDTDNQVVTAAISSALTQGERFLSIHFLFPSVSEEPVFAWEDWKQQLVFAALLSGGFADEEELYRVFSKKEMSEGEITLEDGESLWVAEAFEWHAKLPAGYCRVRYRLSNNPSSPKHSPSMNVTIYESESLYKKMQQQAMERKEELERERTEASL